MSKSPSKKFAYLQKAIADESESSEPTAPTAKAKAQTGRTLYYRGQTFRSLKGAGFKSNYYCVETGEDYWISGPKRKGGDVLYGGNLPIEIDADVREEYWTVIRRQPERALDATA